MAKREPDKKRIIIKKLMEDPRASYTDIARAAGTSTEYVRQKIKKLKEQEHLKFYCVADAKELGKRRCTIIIEAPLTKKMAALDRLKKFPTAFEIHSGILSNTLIMDIITDDPDKDTHDLLKILEDLEAEVKEILETEIVYFNPECLLK